MDEETVCQQELQRRNVQLQPDVHVEGEIIINDKIAKSVIKETVIKDGSCSNDDKHHILNRSSVKTKRKRKRNQRQFVCFHCQESFISLKKRSEHVKEMHSMEDQLTTICLFGKVVPGIKNEMKQESDVDKKTAANGRRQVICRLCGSSQDDIVTLIDHLNKDHCFKKNNHICPTCFKRFDTLADYNLHIEHIHPYECLTCGKQFITKPSFRLHRKRHLQMKPYRCTFCEKSFVTKQKLTDHTNTHTGMTPIKCNMCDKMFKRHSNYRQHKKYFHMKCVKKMKEYLCSCGEVFRTKVGMLRHSDTHGKPKSCSFCSQKFQHDSSLTRHIRRFHNSSYLNKDSTHATAQCHICEVTYLKSSLQSHLRIHDDQKPFACRYCEKTFRTNGNLQKHKERMHTPDSMKSFQCTFCRKGYSDSADFSAHTRSHKNIKPFNCNICGGKFGRKYSCSRHVREHASINKAYQCDKCDKSFHRIYNLTQHERTHSGYKPYLCVLCGKLSATKSNHNSHLKAHSHGYAAELDASEI